MKLNDPVSRNCKAEFLTVGKVDNAVTGFHRGGGRGSELGILT